MQRRQGSNGGRLVPALFAVSLLLSSCTITLLEDSHGDAGHVDGDGHSEEAHELAGVAHVEGDGHTEAEHNAADEAHDHGSADDGEARIDHHGNPIYDEDERVYEQVAESGLSVEFTVENFIGVGGRGGELAPRLVEGQHANLQFHITDADTGQPRAGLRPAVWLDAAGDGRDCAARIEGYLSGGLEARPVIDLNSYFILGMNRDNTISVIDPLVDVGGMTNLFSLILLQGTPQDWAMVAERSRLFVTMPDIQRVAVVDLDAFLVEETIALPSSPGRIVVGPDGESIWVTLGGGGIAVIDANTLDVEVIPTDDETTAIAFSGDGTRAVVGTVGGALLVDAIALSEIDRVALSGAVATVAISAANGDAYVAQPGSGLISVVGVDSGAEEARLQVALGVAAIDISLDGRWAVAVSPSAEAAFVIDTETNIVTHQFPVDGIPDQVTFTEDAAYIHTSGSPSVTAVPIAEIDPAGEISVLTVPIGEAPSASAAAPAIADAITPTPDGDALLIASPADDVVYFYTEGSQAALGGFQGHTLQPRAVQVVDRSLKEPAPGVYTGSVRIPRSGELVVAFLLNDPTLSHCFSFTARASEEPLSQVEVSPTEVEVLSGATGVAGQQQELRFALRDSGTDELVSGLEDVIVMFIQTGGTWNVRVAGTPDGDGGYAAVFTPPSSGTYMVLIAAPSLGLGFESLAPKSVHVSTP